MIDEDFKVYLIEINTNPCYEFSSTLLARIIPTMINNALKYYYKIKVSQLILYTLLLNLEKINKSKYLKIINSK